MIVTIEVHYTKSFEIDVPEGLEHEALEDYILNKTDEISPCPEGMQWYETYAYNEDGEKLFSL